MKRFEMRPAVIVAAAALSGLLVTGASAFGDESPPSPPLGCSSSVGIVGDHSVICASSGAAGTPPLLEDGDVVDVDVLAATGRSVEAVAGFAGLLTVMTGLGLRRRAARLQRSRV